MSHEVDQDLAEQIAYERDVKGKTWKKVGEKVGLHPEAARAMYRRRSANLGHEEAIEQLYVEEESAATLVFEDKKVAEDIDWREFVELAEQNKHVAKRLDDTQRIANITINTDKPIGIMFCGDWHLGDGGTNHRAWARDMNFFIEHPELYMVDLGDDRQNMRRFRELSAVLNQVLPPKMQARMVRSLINELTDKNRLLAKVGGNHDVEFDERTFGESVQTYLLEKMKAPHFSNKGLVRLTVGEIEYTMLVFHKSRFSSFLRANHGAMREHQLAFPADIVAGGHDHQPTFEVTYRYNLAREAGFPFGGETLLIKAGTYQDQSKYGWKYFHDGGIGAPTVVLYPNERKMIPFMQPVDACSFLAGVRAAS